MGMRLFGGRSSSSYDSNRSGGVVVIDRVREVPEKVDRISNPDPYNWILNDSYQDGRYLLVSVTYPDCTNYEGKKVMLYKGVTVQKLKDQRTIDPNFSSNKRFYSPVARFEPTVEGWEMGKRLISALSNKGG